MSVKWVCDACGYEQPAAFRVRVTPGHQVLHDVLELPEGWWHVGPSAHACSADCERAIVADIRADQAISAAKDEGHI